MEYTGKKVLIIGDSITEGILGINYVEMLQNKIQDTTQKRNIPTTIPDEFIEIVRENVRENDDVEMIKLNKTQKSIISLIKQDKYITQAEISEKLNKTTRTIRRNMKMLQEENLKCRDRHHRLQVT